MTSEGVKDGDKAAPAPGAPMPVANGNEFAARLVARPVEQELKASFLDYAMSVIVSRALPDVRDGLKPVHRRVLYAMNELGVRSDRPRRKSALIVGEVMGKYHPHGDLAIYDTLVRMAQDFSLRNPLVDGQGNFGSVDGDNAAAMRYCLTGDARIQLEHATPSIASLNGNAPPNSEHEIDVRVRDHRGRSVPASRFFHSGDHPTVRVRTREGYEVTGSKNHPLLCLVQVGGVPLLVWKLLSEVRKGDRVVLLRRPREDDTPLTPPEWRTALLLGAFVSEGFASGKRAGFNNIDPEYFGLVAHAYDTVVGGPGYVTSRTIQSGSLLYELDIQNLGALQQSPLAEMAGLRSAQKAIPEVVWCSSLAFKRTFLQSLFTGDGSSSLLPRNTIQISYTTYSKQLARDVQTLLLEFGVVSRLCHYEKGETRVVITNRRDARIFAKNVGFLGAKQEKLERNLGTIPERSRALGHDHVPYLADYIRSEAGARAEDGEWLRRHNVDRIERWEQLGPEILARIGSEEARRVVAPLASGDYYYAPVEAVEDAGVQPVFSVRVDTEHHSFVANGFVNHNTEARLAPIADELLADLDKETVDFVPNYDATLQEPTVLPAKFPQLLVNGSSGIAVGMATNIPPHNLGEIIDATVHLIERPEAPLGELLQFVKGPDFPTGGILMGRAGVVEAYNTGRGKLVVRGRVGVEKVSKDRPALIITELPYQVNKANLLVVIAELVKEKRIDGIHDLRDESDRDGMRVVIELKRDADPGVVENQLYAHTQLQSTFGVLNIALVRRRPVTLGLKSMLAEFIEHRVEVITRRTKFELRKAQERAHILEGLLIALDHVDEVVQLIRQSKSVEEAQGRLMARFALSEPQAKAILDMRLAKLASLEIQQVRDEHAELMRKIAAYQKILSARSEVLAVAKTELLEIKQRYPSPRRTEMVEAEAEAIDMEALIAEHDVVVTVTKAGYTKRIPLTEYRSQGRGGKGVIGTETRDEDVVSDLIMTSTHDYVMFFTTRGRCFWLKAYAIPEATRYSRGKAIVNLLPGLEPGERVTAAIPVREFAEDRFVFFVTRKGTVKRTALSEFKNVRAAGIRAISLEEGDEVLGVALTDGKQDIVLAKASGKAVRFAETDVRAMGRTAFGVIGVDLEPGARGAKLAEADEVVALASLSRDEGHLLTIKANGRGKRTPVADYPRKHRGGMGVITIDIEETVDGRLIQSPVVGMVHVLPGEEVMVSTERGVVIRVPVDDVPEKGRAAQGNWIIRPETGDRVVTIAKVARVEATVPPAV